MEGMRQQKRIVYRRGAAMVEMAIVLTLLMMLTLGAIKYGWLFLTMQRMTNAARHGARVAAALGASIPDAEAQMTGLLGNLTPLPGTSIVLDDANDVVIATVLVSGIDPKANLIQWEALPSPETLRARVTMAKEGAP